MKMVGSDSVVAKLAAVAACLMATAIMADETISADVTLIADADWRAKGVVTIAEGVTVNLNGHSLALAGLAGAGTIDSTIADLTSPSGTSSSPTTFHGGNAGNLFNNNFARSGADNTRRIIVAQNNLPLIVDYDFGAGNEQTVNMYKVYCGPISGYTKRCPKSWTFEGSNDNQNWTVLDTRDSETGWAATECRTKTFENTTAYRYYRFKATAAQDNTDGFLEMVQLEYFDSSASACGELRLDIPAETTVENTGVAITGSIKITLNLEGRTTALGEKLIRWRKSRRPAEVTFQFDATTAQSGIEPFLTDTGLFYGVDPDSTLAEYAQWTGAANDGDPANPANWTCKNVAGSIIENGLPGAITTVSVAGATDLQAPADSSFVCEVFEIGECRLTADCDWRAVAKFTLDAESKIDLNGHKLYVNGLYGSGEVTGGEFDLTTDDASRVYSPTIFASNTKAANLFNNNFTRGGTDSNRRILIVNANLPLVVDYDFGEATYVDEYAIYVGPQWCKRTPRRWNVYGSDDGSSWTLLDSRTVLDIGDSALCRRYRIAVPAAYRRYRYEATEALDPDDGVFEMVQIEYGDTRNTGELHVNVPEGETVRNANVLLTGKFKLVKEGAGTFIAAKPQQTYCAGTEIVAGLLQEGTYGFNAPLGNAGAITVGPEGRFNMAMGAFCGYPFVLAGGVVSSSLEFTGSGRTIPSLTLTADSLFDATHTFGLVADSLGSENAPSTLDLGGHTMSVVIGGDGRAFRLKNTYATNGTIRVTQCAEGGIFSFVDTAVRAATVDFEIKGEVHVQCSTTVRNLFLDESVSTGNHTPLAKVSVLGTFKTESLNFPNVELCDGAIFDLREKSGAFAVESTSEFDSGLSFADGATVMLDLRGRRFTNGDYVITWETPPENIASLKFNAYGIGISSYTLSTDAGGVRIFSGMVITIR